ncbi:MAG: glycosylase [Christensenellaceae bacterium]|jgi:maltose alpha-D-glucosyltransferase/alpha-amylase|nr:glycosylase [Christensenellaceae bacterium]
MKHDWLESAVFYEIYPTSFYDSNGDGVGDIKGIIEKLDYIKDLGANAIWLNPCFCSPFGDGGYDITDYYTVDPRFGSNADLEKLFSSAKKKGISILLDLVAGHTSIEHPWFQESQKHEKNEFSDIYVWKPGEEPFNNNDNKFLSGIAQRPDMFMINYYAIQPAINYGFYKRKYDWQSKPDDKGPIENRDRVVDICKFWLSLGASGFRVDMAGQMVKNDPKQKGNIEFWNYVIPEIKKYFPMAVFVSEWYVPRRAVGKSAFDIDFSSEWFIYVAHSKKGEKYRHRSCYLGDESKFFKLALARFMVARRSVEKKGYHAVALGNHDKARMSYGRNHDISKVTFAFHLLMPHLPFIYYGDEIGIPYRELPSKDGGYRRTGSRTPMQWEETENRGFSASREEDLYLPIDKESGISVSAQKNNPESLLETVRAIIKLKREMKCFRIDAGYKVIKKRNGGNPFIFKRFSAIDEAIVILLPRREKLRFSTRFIKDISSFEILKSNIVFKNGIAQSSGEAFAVLYRSYS